MMKLKVFSFSAVSYLYQYITSIGFFYKNVGILAGRCLTVKN